MGFGGLPARAGRLPWPIKTQKGKGGGTVGNRWRYLFVLQGDYGFGLGWEDICESENHNEMVRDRESYRKNAPEYRYRIVQRRELGEGK